MNRFVSSVFALAFGLALGMGVAHAADETISVTVDQAEISKLPMGTATVVIGNPAIADVTIQKSGIMVVTGKNYGLTNLVALDTKGAVITEMKLRVKPLTESIMTVHRGVNRESYTCAPNCEKTLRLGDSDQYFSGVANQSTSRNQLATQQPR